MVHDVELQEALNTEQQLLSVLRPIIAEGRKILARHEHASYSRIASRLNGIISSSEMLLPLVFAEMIGDGPEQQATKTLIAELTRIERSPQSQVAGATIRRTRKAVAHEMQRVLQQMRQQLTEDGRRFLTKHEQLRSLLNEFWSMSD